jgi:hypothetical protein
VRPVIVCQRTSTELVPRVIADKIAERDATLAVRVSTISNEIDPRRSVCRQPDSGYLVWCAVNCGAGGRNDAKVVVDLHWPGGGKAK